MSATMEVAVPEMLEVFRAAWATTGYTAAYPEVVYTPPTTDDPWASIEVTHVDGRTATLADATGQRRRTRAGFLAVQVRASRGKGLRQLYQLGKVVTDAYEDTRRTASGVVFSNVRFNEVGPDGQWVRGDALVDFSYDEVR